jgi:hypothetical protein
MASRLTRLSTYLSRPLQTKLSSHLPSKFQSQVQFQISKPRPYTTAPMSESLISLAKQRRTIYKLGKTSPVPDSKIEDLVNAAILHVPSSFNTQSTRLVVLLHDQHERLWDIAIEAFEGLVASGKVPQEVMDKQTRPKLNGFKGAYGTVCRLLHNYTYMCNYIYMSCHV